MNIFIGKNSSGKSSILSALLATRSLSIGRNHLPPPFKDFEWLHRKGTDEPMLIWLCGQEYIEPLEPDADIPNIKVQPSLNVRFLESGTFLSVFSIIGIPEDKEVSGISLSGFSHDSKTEILQSTLLDYLPVNLQDKFRERMKNVSPFQGYSWLVRSMQQDITHKVGRVSLLGFSYTDYTRNPTVIEKLTLDQRNLFHKYLLNMVYISVTRGFLDSGYTLDDNVRHSLSSDTVSPAEILNIQAYEDYRDDDATQIMKQWAGKFGIDNFEIKIQPGRKIEGRGWIPSNSAGEPLPVCFYGFGSNQFVTVIAKCVFAPKNAPILVEEPEIHLHPEMQALATDFLIEMMKDGHQLFITTHSEHLIGRIQRRLADKSITPEDVGIFWVQHNQKDGTIVEEVSMDADGIFHEGLRTFMEFLEEEIAETQIARQQNFRKEGI